MALTPQMGNDGNGDVPHRKTTARERQTNLQNQIIDLILELKLSAGDPMPPEHELMERLGAGRNTLREATKVLEAIGVLEVRHGFGTFVSNDALTPMVRALTFRGKLSLFKDGREALELVDVRQALETGLVGYAAASMTPQDIERLKVAAEGIASSTQQGESIARWDQEFHSALFAPIGNELLSGLLDTFWQVYNNIAASIDTVAPLNTEDVEKLSDIHWSLYEAIRDRDISQSVALMSVHFDGIRERLEAWSHTLQEKNKVELRPKPSPS